MSKVILVTGATGNQGGAVLDALIKQNHGDFTILALTRDATSSAAQRISTRSKAVQIVTGNFNDSDAIFRESRRLTGRDDWGVFMVQSVIAGGVTAAQEETRGKGFIDACVVHHVEMLVYTSIDRGGDLNSPTHPTPVSVWASKHRIEQHLFETTKGTDTRWLVLRPTGLIESLLRNDFISKISFTSWKLYVKPNRSMQWISCKDIGCFALQGFLDPAHWQGQCLSLTGWEGTFGQANQISKDITGHGFPLTFRLLTRFVCGVVVRDLSLSHEWTNEKGFGADIQALKRLHSGLLSLGDCLRAKEVRE